MNFDPTCDYDDTDGSQEEKLVRWQFTALLKNLVMLSSSADIQTAITGIGATCDEMAMDFDTYFTLPCQHYLDYKLLTAEQVTQLKELDDYFNARSGDQAPDFWDDDQLDVHPDWQVVRQKAKTMLALLGVQDLTIEWERTEKFEITEEGIRLTLQTTKTRLIRKKRFHSPATENKPGV